MSRSGKRNAPPSVVEDLQSRAHARSKFRAQRTEAKRVKDARIAHIFDLMTSNQWVDGRSEVELAQEWKRSVATVRANAEEAKRQVRAAYERTDQADRVARFVVGLQEQMQQCAQKENHRDFVRIAQLYADVTGLNAPTKVEVSGTIGDLLSLGLSGDPGSPGPDPEVEGKP